MAGWFAKNLGDAMLAPLALDQIEASYVAIYGGTDSRENAAVFIRHESEGRLHCEVMAYFSPDAYRLAEEFDAVPCRRPSTGGLGLHVGPAGCWQALFEVTPRPIQ